MNNPNVKLIIGLDADTVQNLRWLLRLTDSGDAVDRTDGAPLNHDDWCVPLVRELEQGMKLADLKFPNDTRGRSWEPEHAMGRVDPLDPSRKVFAMLPSDYYNRVKEDVMAVKQPKQPVSAPEAKTAIVDGGHLDHAQVEAAEKAGLDPVAIWTILSALAGNPQVQALFKQLITALLAKLFPVTPPAPTV